MVLEFRFKNRIFPVKKSHRQSIGCDKTVLSRVTSAERVAINFSLLFEKESPNRVPDKKRKNLLLLPGPLGTAAA